MAGEQREYMVLRDDEDNYYAVPREMVDHHRVRREWKTKIKQYLDGEDVEGFIQGGVVATSPSTVSPSALHIIGIITAEELDLFEAGTPAT
jgi:hypothetical protein